MSEYFYNNGKRYKVTSGDKLVRIEGERQVDDELTTGYSGQLREFIQRRDEELAKQTALLNRNKKVQAQEVEPGL